MKRVQLISAAPVKETHLSELAKLVPDYKDAEVVNTQDPQILAGVILVDSSKMIDLSLDRALHNLQTYLYEAR